MSVLSHTAIMQAGTGTPLFWYASRLAFHSPANCFSAPSAWRSTASGLGFRRAVARSPAGRFSLIHCHRAKYSGTGRPEFASTGMRGIFTMPLSMASTNPKSDASHGARTPCVRKGSPSVYPLPRM